MFADHTDALSPVLDMIRLHGGRASFLECRATHEIDVPSLVYLRRGRGSLGMQPVGEGDLIVAIKGVASFQPEGACDLLIGDFWFDSVVAKHLLAIVPEVIVLKGEFSQPAPWLNAAINGLLEEAKYARPGMNVVVSRILDTMVVRALRDWAVQDSRENWLAAASDPRIGRVLALIHKDPSADLSLETLANVAGMSRTSFVQTFRQLVGYAPGAYVNCWRLDRASVLISEGKSASNTAAAVGYKSVAAFSRAFSGRYGISPDAWRKQLSVRGSNTVQGGDINP